MTRMQAPMPNLTFRFHVGVITLKELNERYFNTMTKQLTKMSDVHRKVIIKMCRPSVYFGKKHFFKLFQIQRQFFIFEDLLNYPNMIRNYLAIYFDKRNFHLLALPSSLGSRSLRYILRFAGNWRLARLIPRMTFDPQLCFLTLHNSRQAFSPFNDNLNEGKTELHFPTKDFISHFWMTFQFATEMLSLQCYTTSRGRECPRKLADYFIICWTIQNRSFVQKWMLH